MSIFAVYPITYALRFGFGDIINIWDYVSGIGVMVYYNIDCSSGSKTILDIRVEYNALVHKNSFTQQLKQKQRIHIFGI